MKKIVKRAVLFLLVLLMLPIAAHAAGRIETDRDVSYSFHIIKTKIRRSWTRSSVCIWSRP